MTKEVRELGLHKRTLHTLLQNGIETTDDLLSKTEDELLELVNFGQVSAQDVRRALQDAGLPPVPITRPRTCPHCGGIIT